MIVVSDTTPISSLYQIGRLELFPRLFKKIIIPDAVYNEILELEKKGFNIDEITSADWIEVKKPESSDLVETLLNDLDYGESEAIALAKELNADFLLIDERKGRQIAESLGINIIGLIGMLIEAKKKGIIPNIKVLLDKLKSAGFWIRDDLYNAILKESGEI